jgi:hypothetical protein
MNLHTKDCNDKAFDSDFKGKEIASLEPKIPLHIEKPMIKVMLHMSKGLLKRSMNNPNSSKMGIEPLAISTKGTQPTLDREQINQG